MNMPALLPFLLRGSLRGSLRTAFASFAVAACSAHAEPVTYVLDPAHSFVHFEVLHFGTSTLRGRIGPVAGSVELDRATQRGSVNLRVLTASVSTGLRVFDARLREPDLLASEAHPEAFFVATQMRFDGDRVADVRGEFTWRGVSQPLSLTALRFACRPVAASDGGAAGEVCGGDFEGVLSRSAFGATFGLPFVGDRVQLRVQVEGLRR